MNLDQVYIADIETKGLLPKIKDKTDFHILGVSYKDEEGRYQIKTTNKEEDVRKLFCNPNNVIVGHNFYLFDVPAIERMFNIKVTATIVDSLFLSWYIEPSRIKEGKKHGLGSYGEDFGVPKEVVGSEQWVGIGKDKRDIIEYYEGLNR